MGNSYTLKNHLIIKEWLDKYNILAIFGDNSIPYREFLANPGPIQCGDFVLQPYQLIRCKQTHSDLVHIIIYNDAGSGILKGKREIPLVDGFICDTPYLFPFVVSADCTPILIVAPDVRVIACVHSGRVGTERNILGKTLKRLITEYKANPQILELKTGPAICKEHYPVDKTTFDNFVSATGIEQDYPYLDLRKVQLQQALATGVKLEHIEISNTCTLESDRCASYRENGTRERQINLIGILK